MATFGIVPSDVNTGYGYIKSSKDNSNGAHNVEEFVKKPDLKTVKFYLEQGNYLLNSVMFMLKARICIEELTRPSPNIATSVNNAVSNPLQDLDFIRLENKPLNHRHQIRLTMHSWRKVIIWLLFLNMLAGAMLVYVQRFTILVRRMSVIMYLKEM